MVEAAPAEEAKAGAVFSMARMTELSTICAADPQNIPTNEFCELLDVIVLLLKSMGSMMSIAFSGKFRNNYILNLAEGMMSSILTLV